MEPPALPAEAAPQQATPQFHVAPALLQEPDDVDALDNTASAVAAPRVTPVPVHLRGFSSRGLTLEAIAGRAAPAATSPAPKPLVATTYTPAQIRAAYGLPALPAAGTTPSAAQAAQMGAGQTIYIVDSNDDPNAAAELSTFNQKFGLPACVTKPIAPGAALPLAAAPTGACQFSVVYSTASGAMTATAPAYNSGWATEIALDVQWAHASAPLARIVLIEAPDASVASLLAAVNLANAMGPGIVSMSFGGSEGSWTASVDSAFSAPGMTYLAATGDSGAGVQWPAVSAHVLAVGGTSLTWSGSGTRAETAWSGSGGGVSQYVAQPAYQVPSLPGLGNPGHRSVADVSFNADPYTGQYLAVISPGSSTAGWLSAGGTSLSTPQWAGLVAIANAVRAQSAKPGLGAPHAALYSQIAAVPGTYASAFADITSGSDGSCASCSAHAGYDTPTGLGTPNATALLATLAGGAAAPLAPVVASATATGTAGTAFTFTVSVTSPDPVTFTLSGAPAGLTIGSGGILSWAAPVAGSYAVNVTAKDAKTGLSGAGVITIAIAAPQPPGVPSGTIVSGKPGVALSFAVAVSSPDLLAFSLVGAPSGMTIGATGVVSWPKPVAGTYNVVVVARDTKNGLSGQGTYTVKIATAGPVITAAAMTGVAGKPLTGTIAISDAGATSLSASISGVPLGMGFSASGLTLTATWPKPVAGQYALKVVVTDNAGLTATASVPVTISAK